MAKASPKGHHYLRILATQCNPSRKKGKENRRRSKRKNNIKEKIILKKKMNDVKLRVIYSYVEFINKKKSIKKNYVMNK